MESKAPGDGGYRHVIRVALPLILSNASATVMSFVDRIFLARYSGDAMAGAAFAGMAAWTLMTVFLGTAGYTGTFVAQYYGAGRKERISTAVWHGIYFALFSGVVLLVISGFSRQIMDLAGHAPGPRREEIIYFRIFLAGGGLIILNGALAAFFGGLGKTYYNMAVFVPANCLNVILNYCLIFGHWGFPRWGTKGAAVATVVSAGAATLTLVAVLVLGKTGRLYGVLRRPRFERDLFARLLRFGVPNGLQWTVDMTGWTIFMMLVCRLGGVQQQAVSVAFSINHLAFLPMVGFGMATSILVGQFIGSGRPKLAEKATSASFKMTLAYMVTVAVVFAVGPGPLVALFKPDLPGAQWPAVYALAAIFMRFVAVYCVFDAVNIVYSGALKGAGDTTFVMFMIAVLSAFGLVIPTYLVLSVFDLGFFAAAAIATAYIGLMAIAFYARYRAGKWKSMRVIESPVPSVCPGIERPDIEA
ncbi:MAG: MATE family efflux transporter [Planctomycetes bacterium]|nr:MATE family efflux transporter [Planctomycetota bacterium]